MQTVLHSPAARTSAMVPSRYCLRVADVGRIMGNCGHVGGSWRIADMGQGPGDCRHGGGSWGIADMSEGYGVLQT